MADATYRAARWAMANATLDLGAPADLRARLVMTNTTCDTEVDVDDISEFSVVDICDDGSYAEVDMAAVAVTKDDVNHVVKVDATSPAFTFAGDGTRDVQAILIISYIDGVNDIPVALLDCVIAKETIGVVTVNFNADGICQF